MSTSDRSFFECNVCFEQAVEPVVTQCGHLFCWSCLSCWLERANDCPVCKAGVSRENVIPIFGRGVGLTTSSDLSKNPSRPVPVRIEPEPRQFGSLMGSGVSPRRTFPFVSFMNFSHSSGSQGSIPLTLNQGRQRAITQFFIFLGLVLLILVVSS